MNWSKRVLFDGPARHFPSVRAEGTGWQQNFLRLEVSFPTPGGVGWRL
ncbi:hypothetical protein [Paenarthrobacter aromaticivorans]|uniref:Uncharacterized protein n=1 Tax=Paenarthrobacter aromaticivorans TaxID=2849150 RepID=A0ABS6I9V1_9MICC|nr:hypothetical protein [Paenarthrobacter sp. MMS21-TAE1-1]MBU8868497.1 hypothetical protein [Paenarthrobacter sp. MMS21-TAE1-1]